MKNIVLIFVLFFCTYSLFAQNNNQEVSKNVVKNVVLINKDPWKVLMTNDGDILAKLKNLPDYLKGYEKISKSVIANQKTKIEPDFVSKDKEIAITKSKSLINADNIHIHTKADKFFDRLEVVFKVGSALLSSDQVKLLNEIANRLVSDRKLKFNLFGFNSEPEYRFYILSKRRMDAVLSYLKVKGVDIDKQVVVNNTVKGKNNKIVFARAR